MATTQVYGDKLALRVLYIRDRAGVWVYYLETRTEQDADYHARRLMESGRACLISTAYYGSVAPMPTVAA